MKLYLAQHGQAVDKKIDPERPLSDQGRQEVGNVAIYLKQSDVEIIDIYHSGKSRAAQTAAIIADILGINQLQPIDGIAPNDPVEPVVDVINNWTDDSMIVGHMPFLPHMASHLLTGNPPSDSDYLPGNMICLERDPHNNWSLASCLSYTSFTQ